jgi:signal transduction histidine kinase
MLTPLFVVPLVSLLALWGFAASVTLLNALREHNFNTENRLYGGQAQMLGLQLTQERSSVFVWLSGGRKAPSSALVSQRYATNAAVGAFERGVNARPGMLPAAANSALAAFGGVRGHLNTIRAEVDAHQISALGAFEAYNSLIDDLFGIYTKLVEVDNSTLYQHALASVEAGRAVEMVDREVTLVNGALAAGGQMTRGERLLFASTVADQRLLIGDALKQLGPALAAGYTSVFTSPAYRQFSAMENGIINSIGSGRPIPVTKVEWGRVSFSLLSGFQMAEQIDRASLATEGTAVGNRLLLQVALAGGLGLVAVVLSVVLMVRFGRRISRELTGLQRSALELSTQRLPQVVEQLSHGEDVEASGHAVPPARIAEIARVAAAFSAVQRTAVEAASGQARLRRGVSLVFRNLAWRSQSLLHRQLALLDRMERTTTDAGTLEELFQLDHLTTRMRRHAEGLIILSGEAPGRGWREPVPVVDVLRAAIAEVEDYTRVSAITRSADALAGTAVADVIHLLAELIENATVNSPANTEITVRAERVAHGIVIEVEDRGLGMSDEEMAAVNERLANPPEFDLADSEKLGFFVVARLAARHNIKITLRMSPYGGVAAIVLLPHEITVMPDSGDTSSISPYPVALASSGWRPVGVAPPARLTVGAFGPDVDTSADDTLGLPKRVRDPGNAPEGAADSVQGMAQEAGAQEAGAHAAGTQAAGQRAADEASSAGPPKENNALVVSLHQGWLGARTQAAEPDDS